MNPNVTVKSTGNRGDTAGTDGGIERVLLLSNSAQIGGGNRSLLLLADGLRKRGVQPMIVHPSAGPMLAESRSQQIASVVVPNQQPSWKHPWQTVSARREWRSVIDEFQPELIHANDLSTCRSISGVAVSAGIPLIAHVRFPPTRDYADWVFRRVPSPQAFIFNSHQMHSSVWPLLRPGSPDSRTYVVHNGVAVDEFHAAPGGMTDRPRIGIVANLLPVKGHEDFLQMAAGLTRDGYDADYWIIGGDIHRTGFGERLERLAEELHLADRIRFWGHRSDVASLVSQLNIAVCASHEEPFGRCLVEAMACEKPVVATRVGGIPEVVAEGVTGFLVEPRSPDQLAAAVADLLDDRQLAATLGCAGRARVEELFSADAHVESILEIYRAEAVAALPAAVAR